MALVLKDRVKEVTSTTGTGTLTLAGAASGYQSFAVIGNGNTTYYAIVDPATGDWEVGLGTYTASGTTLSRSTILESSNSGSAVNFGAGAKEVFCTYPAEKSALFDQIPTNNNQLTNGAGYITGNQTITLSGDVSGSGTTSIAVTVADDSHNHVISNVDGLQTALDAKQAAATALTTSTTFGGDVSGTYNSIAVTNDSHTHDTRYYTETEIGNFFSGTTAITGYSKTNWDTAYGWGNHASAGYLTGNQTITLSGDVSGSGTTSISVTVADDSHNHIISNVDGLQTALDGKLSTSGTAANSQLLDSLDSTQFLRSDADDTFTGTLTFSTYNDTIVRSGGNGSSDTTLWRCNANATTNDSADYGFSIKYMGSRSGNENSYSIFSDNATGTQVEAFTIKQDGTLWQGLTNKIWHAGNDGSGSGLDADLWDGNQFASYLNQAVLTSSSPTFTDLTLSGGDLILSGTGRIQGIDTVSASTDAASKGYVDTAVAGAESNVTSEGLYEMANTISSNYSITSGNNAMSAGPITVASGVSVTVPSGSVWTIV